MISSDLFAKATSSGFFFGLDLERSLAGIQRLKDEIENGTLSLASVKLEEIATHEDFVMTTLSFTYAKKKEAS